MTRKRCPAASSLFSCRPDGVYPEVMMNFFEVFFESCLSRRLKRAMVLRATCGCLVVLLGLAGCDQGAGPGAPSTEVVRRETVVLPTGAPTAQPSPVNTRVLPLESFTPGPTSTVTPIPAEVRGLVVDVIDGDTIAVVMDGDSPGHVYQVRYIGVNAPPRAPEDPWGVAAYEANRNLTRMKVVRLVRDESETDGEGYLLRYVFVGDQMASIIMAEQGLARAAVAAPDTRYQAEILEAENRAREGRLGVWGGGLPTNTPTRSRPAEPAAAEASGTVAATAVITNTVVLTTTNGTPPATSEAATPEATVTPETETSPTPAEAETGEPQAP